VKLDGPTLEEIRSWPATVPVPDGGRALGYSASWSYQLVAQGEFPCKVITVGRRSRVVTASLLAMLDAGPA
jgi:predicted DNA-binding transcriptional regulator AlpA